MLLSNKLQEINHLKVESDRVVPQKDWDQAFLEKVKIEFTYNSNKIEGNTITYGQTVKLLKDLVTPKNASAGEVLDVVNHHMVLNTVFRNYHYTDISEEGIKDLHYALMKNIEQWSDDVLYSPGQYKSFENATMRSTGKIYTYMQPMEVAGAITELVTQTNALLKDSDPTVSEKHPLTIATFFHQRFLNEIHPFSDGNGRIGRILTNLILLKKGYPPIFIKEVDRNEYLTHFEMVDQDSYAMLDFMSDRLLESLKIKIKYSTENTTE